MDLLGQRECRFRMLQHRFALVSPAQIDEEEADVLTCLEQPLAFGSIIGKQLGEGQALKLNDRHVGGEGWVSSEMFPCRHP